MQNLIHKFTEIGYTDDLGLSVKETATKLLVDYKVKFGRPHHIITQPNYCDKNVGIMSYCGAAKVLQAQKDCFFHDDHSYNTTCLYYVKDMGHHCSSFQAQKEMKTLIELSVPYTDEQIQAAWEHVIAEKRSAAYKTPVIVA